MDTVTNRYGILTKPPAALIWKIICPGPFQLVSLMGQSLCSSWFGQITGPGAMAGRSFSLTIVISNSLHGITWIYDDIGLWFKSITMS